MIGLIVQTMLVGRCWKLTKNLFVLVISIVFITAGHVAGIYMVGAVLLVLHSNQHEFGDRQ